MKYARLIFDPDEGLGNRLFAYVWAKLEAKRGGFELSHPGISSIGIPPENEGVSTSKDLKPSQNFLQDYSLFADHLDEIKSWDIWSPVSEVNENDLVIHLRAGNRFVARNAKYSPQAKDFQKAFDNIDFGRLHIVTNMKKTTEWSLSDIVNLKNNLKEHGGDGVRAEKYRTDYPFLSDEEALEYTNSQIECFNQYDPVWVNGSLKEDFDYLRKFKKILFPRSTLSWWAAVVGVADEVYVYGPWAPHKRMTSGWLGSTNYSGWKSWG